MAPTGPCGSGLSRPASGRNWFCSSNERDAIRNTPWLSASRRSSAETGAGVKVICAASVWALGVRQPDILIAGDGHSVAVRGRDARLHLIRTGKDTFAVKEWLAADADPRTAADASGIGTPSARRSTTIGSLPRDAA